MNVFEWKLLPGCQKFFGSLAASILFKYQSVDRGQWVKICVVVESFKRSIHRY